jgi:hypothetical protein
MPTGCFREQEARLQVLAEILLLHVRLRNRARVQYRRLLLRRWYVSRLWRWERWLRGSQGVGSPSLGER